MIESEAVEFIQRADLGEAAVVLLLHRLLADPCLSRAFDLGIRQAVGGERVDFLHQFGLGEVELLRRGAQIESEQPGAHAEHLRGPHAVGEAVLFADRFKEPARHVGARFINQIEHHAVGMRQRHGGEAGDEKRLLLVLRHRERLSGVRRKSGERVAFLTRPRGHGGERFANQIAHFCKAHVAEDGEHGILRHHARGVESGDPGARQSGERFRRALAVQRKRMRAIGHAAEFAEGEEARVILLLLERGDLTLDLTRDFLRGE